MDSSRRSFILLLPRLPVLQANSYYRFESQIPRHYKKKENYKVQTRRNNKVMGFVRNIVDHIKMNWVPRWLCPSSSPTEQERTVVQLDNKRESRTCQESDISKEFMQPQKRQRKTDEQSMMVYGKEQGSSFNIQLTCDNNLDWLSSYSIQYPNIMILREKIIRLLARKRDILEELKHEEIQPAKKQRKVVQHWLTEVQDKMDDIQSMIMNGEGSSSNSNLFRCIKRFSEEVDELHRRGEFPKGLVLLNHESTRLPIFLGKEPVGINFKQNTEQILEWLQNHEHSIIGVYGMGGVGKTTLLQKIHDQLLHDSNLYGKVYWVSVSQNCTLHKLQRDIAKVLGVDNLGVDDEMKRAAIIHKRLAFIGSTILILDDMWEQFSVCEVGIPLEASSCKVILSTRSLAVCRKMGCKGFVIKVKPLSDDEAWDFFVDKLEHYNRLKDEVKELARSVAQECGGLPLAIATMACSMKEVVDIYEWKNALNELKCVHEQIDMNEKVLQILQFSYDRLKEERDKDCFLSCVLYGEDVAIERETLIDVWINEGMFDKIESREHQVVKSHAILNKLENWCLLESVVSKNGVKFVKMHDLVRDMAITITQKHPRFIARAREGMEQVLGEEQWSNDLVKVSLSHNKLERIPSSMAPMTPILTVLMLNGNQMLKEIPESFFRYMKALKVIDLSFTDIEKLPESVSDLVNLRALLLRGCQALRYVPPVANLTELREMDLHGCMKLEAAPKGLERLKRVERISYLHWDTSDMSRFNQFIQSSLSSLSRYTILVRNPTLFKTINQDVFWAYKNGVWIIGWEYTEDKSCWLLPETVEMLGLKVSDVKGRSLGDVFPSLGLSMGKATYLKDIDIEDCRGLISITKVEALDSFSCLEYLTIRGCPNMKMIFESNNKGTIRILSLPNLRWFQLIDLPKIKVIFPLTYQLHLPKLVRILVSNCEEVEEMFASNKGILSNLNFSLPNLHELHLINLPKLKRVFPFTEQPPHLPNLKTIEVFNCWKLGYICKPLPKVMECNNTIFTMKYNYGEQLEILRRINQRTQQLSQQRAQQDFTLHAPINERKQPLNDRES